ncbi:MAG TPA: hypothetical protein VK155_02775 [Bacteroidales bacterium]|jgi:hypothetical protein|nr:hypothetical protein [Bacteroidales bacterium]
MFPVLRHASSHGFSVLVCTIISALLIELLKPKLPHLMAGLAKISTKIISMINLPMSTENMNIVLLASILALIWGIFFKLSLNRNN